MSLTFIGLGLYDKKDVSLRGLEIIKQSEVIYLEYYTSILHSNLNELEQLYEKKIIIATRDMVEGENNQILEDAQTKKVAFLVAGDVFSATTHSDLFLRAKEKEITVDVIYNASILTAVGKTGLQLYKFGKTTSLVFFEGNWKPQTAYDVVLENKKIGLHTLILLDIKVAEASKEDMLKGVKLAQEPRFMTIHQAIEQLLEIEQERQEGLFLQETKLVGCARVGSPNEKIKFNTLSYLLQEDFGGPLHIIIVPGNLHFHEEEVLTKIFS